MMNQPKYLVTRRFIGGLLNGLTSTQTTSVQFQVGWACESPVAGSPYIITAVQHVCSECGHVANVQADCKMWACAVCTRINATN